MLFRLFVLVQELAVSRAGRIDEHEIDEAEPAFGVVYDERRRRWRKAVAIEAKPPGRQRAESQPSGARAGSAVEDEGDWPRQRIGVGAFVRDKGHVRPGRAALRVGQTHGAGARGEGQFFPRQRDHVLGGDLRRQAERRGALLFAPFFRGGDLRGVAGRQGDAS